MVVRIGNYHSVRTRHRDVMGMFQLSQFVAHRAELAHKRSIRLENLNPAKDLNISRHWNQTRTGFHLNSVVFLVTDVDET